MLQADGYAVCLFSIDNSLFFSIFWMFAFFQAPVDVVQVRKAVANVFCACVGGVLSKKQANSSSKIQK